MALFNKRYDSAIKVKKSDVVIKNIGIRLKIIHECEKTMKLYGPQRIMNQYFFILDIYIFDLYLYIGKSK